jgi:hypothetical protein
MVPAFSVTSLKSLMAEEDSLLTEFFCREEEVKKAIEAAIGNRSKSFERA